MKAKGKAKLLELRGGGFVACYKGEVIARAQKFDTLASKAEVRELLGKKGLVIKHSVPEGMIAVY